MTEFSFDQIFIRIMQEHNLDTVVLLGHLTRTVMQQVQ